MAWSAFRKATDDDKIRLYEAAERFCRRHNIDDGDASALDAVEFAVTDYAGAASEFSDRAKRLRPLWRKAVHRTLSARPMASHTATSAFVWSDLSPAVGVHRGRTA